MFCKLFTGFFSFFLPDQSPDQRDRSLIRVMTVIKVDQGLK